MRRVRAMARSEGHEMFFHENLMQLSAETTVMHTASATRCTCTHVSVTEPL